MQSIAKAVVEDGIIESVREGVIESIKNVVTKASIIESIVEKVIEQNGRCATTSASGYGLS